MNSDKTPERIYYVNAEKFGFWTREPKEGEVAVPYIREDLTLDARLREPGSIIEYETEKQLAEMRKTVGGNIANMQRRREMFESVAFSSIRNGSFTWEEIESQAIELIKRADKFARGEE